MVPIPVLHPDHKKQFNKKISVKILPLMLTEAALLPKNLSSHLFFSFVISFYYGSGSAKTKSYGSSGFGSATLN
jgi:uncharacterized membrane protein